MKIAAGGVVCEGNAFPVDKRVENCGERNKLVGREEGAGMKYVVIIGDGMADNAVPSLGGKTPLEYAKIPVMDALAAAGELGAVRTVPQGVCPGSDTAILNIFGYDPRRYYSGRSPLEAAGCGVQLAAGDVSYRCNMVALEDGDMPYADRKILSHSGGSIEGVAAGTLMRDLLADPRFQALAQANQMTFHVNPSFRHIAVQKGVDIDGLVAAPPHDHLGERIGTYLPDGCAAAAGLAQMMELSHEILDAHPINRQRRAEGKLPANGIWFWAEGTAIALPSFVEKYHKAGVVISAVPLVQGIGVLAGFRVVQVDGATGELDTNYEGKADAAVQSLLQGADLAVVHVEAPDECTHNGDTPGKIQAIEWLDSRCIARLKAGLEQAGEAYRLLILSDHKTLTDTRGHDGDPVPYILFDSREDGSRQGGTGGYSEAEAAQGPFLPEGDSLMGRLLQGEG